MKLNVTNAIITSARIWTGDRGLLTANLDLDYGGSGQSFGGYVLYLPKSYGHHKLMSCAGHFIWRCMEIAGVESWDRMVGRTIRVQQNYSHIEAIGHIVKDDWFNPREDFDKADAA